MVYPQIWEKSSLKNDQIQVTPPTSSRRRRRAAAYEDDFDTSESGSKNDDNVHPALSSLHLPAPDPSCEIINIFGTPRNDEVGQLEQVWAHQIATILFESSIPSGDGAFDLSSKPVIVGMGFKGSFLDNMRDLEDIRMKYAQVMQLLLQSVLSP